MAAPHEGNGFQRVSLSSSDSGHEQSESETEPCEEALPMELDEVQSGGTPGGGRFPANTPITPLLLGSATGSFAIRGWVKHSQGMAMDGNALIPFPLL